MVWLDGKLLPDCESICSAGELGLSQGMGVFETLGGYEGKPFAFSKHYQRLLEGADRLGLVVPEAEQLKQAIADLVVTNNCQNGRSRIRISLYAGVSLSTSKCAITVAPFEPYNDLSRVVISGYRQNEHSPLTGIKSTSYAANIMALDEAKREGADEVIFANSQGLLCEGATSNVFVIKSETLMTPTLSSGCLAGITRSIVIDLCDRLGIDLLECDVPVDCLIDADEVFLTSSLREVHPVMLVDGVHLPTVAGTITRQLQDAYRQEVIG